MVSSKVGQSWQPWLRRSMMPQKNSPSIHVDQKNTNAQDKHNFVLFAKLPAKGTIQVCTLRNIPNNIEVYELKQRLELLGGIPSNLIKIETLKGNILQNSDVFEFGKNINDGETIRVVPAVKWEGLLESVWSKNMQEVARYMSVAKQVKSRHNAPTMTPSQPDVDSVLGSALFIASKQGSDQICKTLIKNGASATYCTDFGNTPLHVASSSGLLNILQLLVAHGVNIRSRNINNKTPLDVAIDNGHFECARWIWLNQWSISISRDHFTKDVTRPYTAAPDSKKHSQIVNKSLNDLDKLGAKRDNSDKKRRALSAKIQQNKGTAGDDITSKTKLETGPRPVLLSPRLSNSRKVHRNVLTSPRNSHEKDSIVTQLTSNLNRQRSIPSKHSSDNLNLNANNSLHAITVILPKVRELPKTKSITLIIKTPESTDLKKDNNEQNNEKETLNTEKPTSRSKSETNLSVLPKPNVQPPPVVQLDKPLTPIKVLNIETALENLNNVKKDDVISFTTQSQHTALSTDLLKHDSNIKKKEHTRMTEININGIDQQYNLTKTNEKEFSEYNKSSSVFEKGQPNNISVHCITEELSGLHLKPKPQVGANKQITKPKSVNAVTENSVINKDENFMDEPRKRKVAMSNNDSLFVNSKELNTKFQKQQTDCRRLQPFERKNKPVIEDDKLTVVDSSLICGKIGTAVNSGKTSDITSYETERQDFESTIIQDKKIESTNKHAEDQLQNGNKNYVLNTTKLIEESKPKEKNSTAEKKPSYVIPNSHQYGELQTTIKKKSNVNIPDISKEVEEEERQRKNSMAFEAWLQKKRRSSRVSVSSGVSEEEAQTHQKKFSYSLTYDEWVQMKMESQGFHRPDPPTESEGFRKRSVIKKGRTFEEWSQEKENEKQIAMQKIKEQLEKDRLKAKEEEEKRKAEYDRKMQKWLERKKEIENSEKQRRKSSILDEAAKAQEMYLEWKSKDRVKTYDEWLEEKNMEIKIAKVFHAQEVSTRDALADMEEQRQEIAKEKFQRWVTKKDLSALNRSRSELKKARKKRKMLENRMLVMEEISEEIQNEEE